MYVSNNIKFCLAQYIRYKLQWCLEFNNRKTTPEQNTRKFVQASERVATRDFNSLEYIHEHIIIA